MDIVDDDVEFATPVDYEEDVEDAEGVSLGSSDTNPTATANEVARAADESTNDATNGLWLPEPESSAEAEVPTLPSSPLQLPLRSPDFPVITRRDDSKGAIHFSFRPSAPLPPKPPASRSSSSLIISPPSTSSTPSPSHEVPRGPGGRFSTSQKGKGKPKRSITTIASSSSITPASASPSFTSVEGGPSRTREKAADRYARYDSNLADVQLRLLALEQEIKSSAASLRLIEAKILSGTPPLSSGASASLPPNLPSAPVMAPRRSLIERLSDDPVSPVSSLSASPEPLVPPPHKKPRLNPARSLSQAALLTAPAYWHLPSSPTSIIHMIDRWRTLFATLDNSQLLPLPYSAQFTAQHRSSHDNDPIQIVLFFDYGALNMFLNIWNAHHSLLPELHGISLSRYSEE
ncbi:hypothetical protein FB446DRAFT_792091 [Lentinula raphanica]|nr:hypothetical protein FB446DRAFT_792091 [Lentinula raphanica]